MSVGVVRDCLCTSVHDMILLKRKALKRYLYTCIMYLASFPSLRGSPGRPGNEANLCHVRKALGSSSSASGGLLGPRSPRSHLIGEQLHDAETARADILLKLPPPFIPRERRHRDFCGEEAVVIRFFTGRNESYMYTPYA